MIKLTTIDILGQPNVILILKEGFAEDCLKEYENEKATTFKWDQYKLRDDQYQI